MAKSANTSRLFLPKSSGGLQLPLVSTTFKKLQCAKAASLMSSRDPLVWHLASQKTLAKASAVRENFRPYQQVIEVLMKELGANQKAIVAQVRRAVVQADVHVHLAQSRSLVVQGLTVRQFCDRPANLWSQAVEALLDHGLSFALNSVTNTLPHNANLQKEVQRET